MDEELNKQLTIGNRQVATLKRIFFAYCLLPIAHCKSARFLKLNTVLSWGGLFRKSEIIPKVPDLGNASEGTRELKALTFISWSFFYLQGGGL